MVVNLLHYPTYTDGFRCDDAGNLLRCFAGSLPFPTDDAGITFIDRNPKHFTHLLDWLREYGRSERGTRPPPPCTTDPPAQQRAVYKEAKYYGMATLLYGGLYAAGGFNHDGTSVTDSVECFNLETRQWEEAADRMPAHEPAGACAAIGHLLYVAGSTPANDTICFNVEKLGPNFAGWSTLVRSVAHFSELR